MEESRSTWQMWHVRGREHNDRSPIDLSAEHAPALVRACWSVRCSIAGVLRWRTGRQRRGTGGVAAGRRVVGLHCRRRRPLHLAADPRRRAASHCCRPARRWVRSSRRRWIWPCSNWQRTAPYSMPGRPHWSARCAPRVPGTLTIAPAGARENPQLCAPSRWPGPGTVAVIGGIGCRACVLADLTGIHTDTLAEASPGLCGTATCPTGRQRSDRRHW